MVFSTWCALGSTATRCTSVVSAGAPGLDLQPPATNASSMTDGNSLIRWPSLPVTSIGARDGTQLRQNLGALGWQLDAHRPAGRG